MEADDLAIAVNCAADDRVDADLKNDSPKGIVLPPSLISSQVHPTALPAFACVQRYQFSKVLKQQVPILVCQGSALGALFAQTLPM
jgi:hypothetical protein